MSLWHYPSNYSKRFIEKWSIQILTCSLLQAKHFPLLSSATKCKCQATYDPNVEAISFAIGRAGAASWFDVLNLDNTNGGPRYWYNSTVSASFRVRLLFAWLRLCQGQEACMQSETLVHINSLTVTKKW